MTYKTTENRIWSTASYGQTPAASFQELSALTEHLQTCRDLSGRVLNLRCRALHLRRFLADRFVTTLLVLGLLVDLGHFILT